MDKKEELELKSKIKKIKKEMYDLKQEELKNAKELSELRRYKENSVSKSTYDDLKGKYDFMEKEFQFLENQIKKTDSYKEEINTLKKRIKNYNDGFLTSELNKKMAKQGVAISAKEKEINRLNKINENLLKEVNVQNSVELNIENCIKYLRDKLNFKTINKYDDIYSIIRRLNKLNAILSSKKTIKEEKRARKNTVIGIINQECVFLDYEGNSYDIKETPFDSIQSRFDYPVKARINDDNTVSILYAYEQVKHMSNKAQENKLVKSKTTKQEQVSTKEIYDKKLNVLLVGTNNKMLYCNTVSEYGLTYSWFDPFEQNPARLNDFYKSCDIAILFKDHMSHAVLDNLDANSDNVMILSNDTARKVRATIRYLISKNNLSNLIISNE